MSNPPTNPPPPANAAHQEPTDAEVVYYDGSPKWFDLGGKSLLGPPAGLLAVALPFVLLHFDYHLPALGWLLCLAFAIVLPMIPNLHARTIRYRITNYRIDYERGLFSKNIDTLELWHVEDLHFHQSLWERLLGVGSIRVESRDQTLPDLVLRGLPDPRPLYETLKQRVIAVKRSRGVIKVDPG